MGSNSQNKVEFEAAEDVINSISAGRGQFPDYLKSIQLYTKTSKNIYNHVRDCHQNSPPQTSKTERLNQPVFLQKIIKKSRFPGGFRQNRIQSICSISPSIGSKLQQQFLSNIK